MIFSVIIPIIIGIVLIIGGYIQKKKINGLIRQGKITKGIVFKTRQRKGGKNPVVRFKTQKNEWVTEELLNGFGLDYLNEGEEVEIIYNPNDLKQVEINQKTTLSLLPYLFMTMGIVFFIYGYINFLDLV